MEIASRDLAIQKLKDEIMNRQTFLKNNLNSTMSSHQFVIVDTDNSLELCKYEKALFEAFNTTNNNLIREIWDWNYVEKRVKRRIPYSSQIIFTMQNGQL